MTTVLVKVAMNDLAVLNALDSKLQSILRNTFLYVLDVINLKNGGIRESENLKAIVRYYQNY